VSKASFWFYAFARCFVQFFLVYFVPLVVVLVLSGWLHTPDNTLTEVTDYVLFGLICSALALIVSGVSPEADETGRWVWAFGVGLLAYAVGWDILLGFDPRKTAFGAGEAGWANVFVTLPAWGGCWYSAVMWWRLRRRRRNAASGRLPHPWLAGVVVGCAVLIPSPSAQAADRDQITEAQRLVGCSPHGCKKAPQLLRVY